MQSIAILLKQAGHNVDYIYTNKCSFTDGYNHTDNDENRKKIVEQAEVNLIKVNVESREGGRDALPWNNTDFFEKFNEEKYDIVTTGGRGVEEYPYNKIFNVKTINTVHGHYVYLQPNVRKYLLICKWVANLWLANGGDSSRMEVLAPLIPVPEKNNLNLRAELGIPEDIFVYGMHQSILNSTVSNNCLAAYKRIESNKNYFLLLGGGEDYKKHAHSLGIKNIKFLNSTSDVSYIHKFLNTLNVFTHSRSDGEVCSSALIEALYHGLPIISHPAGNMGHAEQIEGNGLLTPSIEEYSNEMLKLQTNLNYYEEISNRALEKYNTVYEYNKLKQQYIDLYQEVLQNN
jgi:hypothetical protein